MTTITKELLDMQLPTGVYRSAAYDANGRLNLFHNVLLLEKGIRPGVRDDSYIYYSMLRKIAVF
jgi:hypothetical protein